MSSGRAVRTRRRRLQTLAFCRALFPDELKGAAPSEGETGWREFVTVRNRSWHGSNLVVLGSAAYTAHFSVGLDLRTWLEDAETLADGVCSGSSLPDALTAYERTRRPKAESLQRAAAASLTWFENVHRYIDKPFARFVFSLLTNNMRINYPRLAKAAPALTRAVDDLAAGRPPGGKPPGGKPPGAQPPSRNRAVVPPMLTPYRLRDLVLPNRIALSPMCMYSASDGTVNDFHLVHLGSRAMGGAGLVLTEMTDVLPEGRISLHCAGMYSPEHVAAWERVVKFVHAHSNSKIGIQLAHAGRKGALTRSWEGHRPLKAGEWEIIAPSPLRVRKGPPGSPGDDPRRHGQGPRRLRAGDPDVGCRRLRHDRIAFRPWLSAIVVHLAAEQSKARRIRRPACQSHAISAGGIHRGSCRLAGRQADQHPHLGGRLGRGRDHHRGCVGDRPHAP